MQKVRAKKALGQHFLRNVRIAETIADALSRYQMPILEVGPGMGVLTEYLLQKYPHTKVVELDPESVSYLKVAFPNLIPDIIEADFLKLPLDKVYNGEPFLLIGNYPYNISSQIFFHMLEYKEMIPAAAGMLQKEVAIRLASGAGNKDYGILSVLLQAWYDVEYLFSVSPQHFSPPPKVQSGVIRMQRNDRVTLGCDESLFKSVVKTTFNRRRKTIRNSLKPLIGEGEIPNSSSAYPYLQKRPEQLEVEDFIILTNAVADLLV